MLLVDFLAKLDRCAINFEQMKNQLEQAKILFEKAKNEFDEAMGEAEKYSLSKGKLKKLTEDRIQSIRENISGIFSESESVGEVKSINSNNKKPKKSPHKKSPSKNKEDSTEISFDSLAPSKHTSDKEKEIVDESSLTDDNWKQDHLAQSEQTSH